MDSRAKLRSRSPIAYHKALNPGAECSNGATLSLGWGEGVFTKNHGPRTGDESVSRSKMGKFQLNFPLCAIREKC